MSLLSPSTAVKYAKRMVEIESRGNGDQINALERVGREVGLKARALRRIINGETVPTLTIFARIREGYLNVCERQIQKLQHEIAVERARHEDDDFSDFDNKIAALGAELNAAKQRTKGI